MPAKTIDHLAKAKTYIAKGEDYYRKAAEELTAEREEHDTPWSEIADRVGKSRKWCQDLVKWHTSGEAASPFAREEGETERKDAEASRRVARRDPDALLDDPESRRSIERAQAKRSRETIKRAREAEERKAERDEADPLTRKLKRQGAVLDVEKDLSGVLVKLAESLEFSYLPHADEFRDDDREEFAAELQEIIDVANGYKTIITTGDETLAADVLSFGKERA